MPLFLSHRQRFCTRNYKLRIVSMRAEGISGTVTLSVCYLWSARGTLLYPMFLIIPPIMRTCSISGLSTPRSARIWFSVWLVPMFRYIHNICRYSRLFLLEVTVAFMEMTVLRHSQARRSCYCRCIWRCLMRRRRLWSGRCLLFGVRQQRVVLSTVPRLDNRCLWHFGRIGGVPSCFNGHLQRFTILLFREVLSQWRDRNGGQRPGHE